MIHLESSFYPLPSTPSPSVPLLQRPPTHPLQGLEGLPSESGSHSWNHSCGGCLGALLKWFGILDYYSGYVSDAGYTLKSLTWL